MKNEKAIINCYQIDNQKELKSTLIQQSDDIMSNLRAPYFTFLMVLLFISGSSAQNELKNYKPDSPELYETIIQLDSIFFDAYNTCNLEKQSAFYSDSIEFYHDKGGLMTSKQGIIDATKRNICGKVTRELVKGSIEVYPIYEYGAVEIGLHKFHNNTEKEGTPSNASKFIMIWQHKNDEWRITRVISLH